jgi:protein tyrosine/serine phosphatase
MRVEIQPNKTSTAGSRRRMRVVRGGAAVLTLVVLSLIGYVFYTIEDSNFHIIAPGRAYRSAQMTEGELAACIEKYGIKSILNLRGENRSTDWYQGEIAAASRMEVIHYDEHLASGHELTIKQMNDMVALLRRAPKPVLIHCEAGADRTGLAAALYCLAIEGQAAEEAAKQLSIWYGHAPFIRPTVSAMDRSFAHYATVLSNHLDQPK